MQKEIATILLIIATPATAGFYTWLDEEGVKHFSDQPVKGAEQIELSEPTVYTPPGRLQPTTLPRAPKASPEKSDKSMAYSQLEVLRPVQDEVIRSNEGKINVNLGLAPALQSGHKFRVFMDDEEISSGLATTNLNLMNVARGSHTLYAVVVDGSGKTLARSQPITFHLKRISILGSARARSGN